jgi:hypothetical protein
MLPLHVHGHHCGTAVVPFTDRGNRTDVVSFAAVGPSQHCTSGGPRERRRLYRSYLGRGQRPGHERHAELMPLFQLQHSRQTWSRPCETNRISVRHGDPFLRDQHVKSSTTQEFFRRTHTTHTHTHLRRDDAELDRASVLVEPHREPAIKRRRHDQRWVKVIGLWHSDQVQAGAVRMHSRNNASSRLARRRTVLVVIARAWVLPVQSRGVVWSLVHLSVETSPSTSTAHRYDGLLAPCERQQSCGRGCRLPRT